jgi:hypothetical protein
VRLHCALGFLSLADSKTNPLTILILSPNPHPTKRDTLIAAKQAKGAKIAKTSFQTFAFFTSLRF